MSVWWMYLQFKKLFYPDLHQEIKDLDVVISSRVYNVLPKGEHYFMAHVDPHT